MTEQEILVEMLRGKDIAMVLMVVLWIVVFVFIALIIYETNRVISCSNEGKTRMAKSDATHTGTYEDKEY